MQSTLGLTVRDLAVERGGRPLLAGLSFTVAPGTALAVTGHNGVGKSTLLRALAGLLKPTAGTVALSLGVAEHASDGVATHSPSPAAQSDPHVSEQGTGSPSPLWRGVRGEGPEPPVIYSMGKRPAPSRPSPPAPLHKGEGRAGSTSAADEADDPQLRRELEGADEGLPSPRLREHASPSRVTRDAPFFARVDGGSDAIGSAVGEQTHYLGHANGLKSALSAVANLRFQQSWFGGGGLVPGEALDMVGLSHCADIPVGLLSAGQKRRVALAGLLVARRPLWLLDEPAAALDLGSEAVLVRLLRDHLAAGGLAVMALHAPLDLPVATLRLGRA